MNDTTKNSTHFFPSSIHELVLFSLFYMLKKSDFHEFFSSFFGIFLFVLRLTLFHNYDTVAAVIFFMLLQNDRRRMRLFGQQCGRDGVCAGHHGVSQGHCRGRHWERLEPNEFARN